MKAICVVCGKEFVRKQKNKIYCSRRCYSNSYIKKNHYKYINKWKAKHPEVIRAYSYVQYHKIPFAKHCQWPNCYSGEHLERHHPSYIRKGCVITLCHRHHVYLHKQKVKFREQDIARGLI